RPELQATLYELMAALHALDGDSILPDSPLAGTRDPYGFIDHEISILHELRSRLDGREPPSLREALSWLASRRSSFPCERLVVVHGDFHRNNVLVRADGAAFVIDWSNVRLADYRTDLAWNRLITQLIFRTQDQSYGGEKELLLYEQMAGKKVVN